MQTRTTLTLFLAFTAVCLLGHVVAGKVQQLRLRGIPLSKSTLYPSDRDFECLDGSRTISFLKVNDDYCDCEDGSDEPGTAACPNGTFYCQNTGHQSVYIPSSWVNDGVCDCCDASDEYSSDMKCLDNCHELGREAWIKAQEAIELAKEGNKIRQEYITRGKQLKIENQSQLTKLQTDREEAELSKQELEQVKKQAEEREAAALEKYNPPPHEEQPALEQKEDEEEFEAEDYFKMLDSDSSGTISIAELQTRATFDKNHDGEVSREEALYFLNNFEELTMQEFVNTAWANVKPFLMLEKGLFKPAERDQENKEQEEQMEYDDEIHEGEGGEDHIEESNLNDGQAQVEEVPVAPESTPEPPAPKYDEETQALIDDATDARQRFQEAERSVLDLLAKIRSIEEKTERDYGLEEEFAVLDGQCFDYTDLEYVYTLCPFGKATQRSKSGGSEVSLGQWREWIGPENAKYTKAKFDRGLTCWNGPSRSTIVTLTCGTENKLLSVSEPNRCEYAMEFSTPALCNPNVEKQDVHDEL
ncbi:glucosidase 2 subunit beta isoform X1 [Trichogramma pretiosum]|uniref:glucosidase 2 subunit beta isoform X1 n=1 Tax=Trichogramma pretiosum TaxID=7493 RepID=UPI0006C9E200|nr:glucosidase 2 subunit beta isoform X1 [Trichogramma pretiosum]